MNREPLTHTLAALTIALGASAAALAQSSMPPGQPPTPASSPTTAAPMPASDAETLKGPVIAVETVTMKGEVVAITAATRQLVVESEGGRLTTVFVGPNVRNFENLKLGDQVTVRFTEAFALAIAKGGIGTEAQMGEIRTKVEADAARQAQAGGKPGVSAMERVTLIANVFDIDRERGILTLRGTSGVPVDIKVSDRSVLDQFNLHDQVVIGYRQSAALSIEPG